LTDAPLVIALGPGFTAGVDCHAVIETSRGHWLGRVIRQGAALPDTGVPGEIAGVRSPRVLRAPTSGVFEAAAAIGDHIVEGQMVAAVDGRALRAQINGILRGIVHSGLIVQEGLKVGDIDPRGQLDHCFTFSDKSFAIAGGVLEAILSAPELCP
jgi:xanthine dehydrogenase accessory factor